ncbi:MAG: beta-galactosidase trimerization domain-containing protein, partial [Clostridia bacterium]|nr:beta-galactosidase trimerization domain-containing protein [Clostridia bacterium]
GWNTRMEAPTPRPGQMTLWTMQSIAHGADYVSYFRWRTSTIGTEIYWHGILDYSGRENRRIAELRQIHATLGRMQELAGTRYEAKVALVRDYDNNFDARLDKWHGRVDWASESALFNAAQKSHTPLDYVYLDHTTAEELAAYSLLFYPHPALMNAERAELLRRYVEQGGTLVFGCRSAYKDMNGRCVMDKLPGLLAEMTQADVLEYSFIAPDAGKVTVDWEGTCLEASIFTDLVTEVGTGHLEGTYTSDYYAGSGALVSNQVGKGKVYYYGSAFSEQAVQVFLEKLGVASPYRDMIEVPESCELAVRRNDRDRYLFVLNYLNAPATIQIRQPMVDLRSGETVCGSFEVPGYDALVLRG